MFNRIKNDMQPVEEVFAGVVEVYDNVISYPQSVIDIANSMEGWRDAEVYEYGSDGVNKSYRSNMILDLNGDNYTSHPVFTYVNDIVEEYLKDYCDRYEVEYSFLEPSQLLCYDVGQYYKRHFDTGPEFPRVISALLYLNDIEKGGETYFINFDTYIKPRAGRLVIFPSNYAYTHEALPPLTGSKYVIVFWTREYGES